MKPYIWFVIPLFIGCSISNTSTNVKNFTKCYINKLPAPFWVCYQSSFQSIGKIHTDKPTRLKQEEAFSVGVSGLVNKLNAKLELFARRVGLSQKELNRLKESVRNFVIVNAIQGDSWFSKKEKMLYVEAKIDKNDFRRFIFEELKNIDKTKLEMAFDETF